MATVVRLSWGRFAVYANDHNPPHAHIILTDGSEFRINILSNGFMDTQPRGRRRREIMSAYRENIVAIWNEWERLHPSDS